MKMKPYFGLRTRFKCLLRRKSNWGLTNLIFGTFGGKYQAGATEVGCGHRLLGVEKWLDQTTDMGAVFAWVVWRKSLSRGRTFGSHNPGKESEA